MRTSVPLWLAVLLKKQRKCSVVPPRWLGADRRFNAIFEAERLRTCLHRLPHHYIEIATDLCKHARAGLGGLERAVRPGGRRRSVRHNKIQAGLRALDKKSRA